MITKELYNIIQDYVTENNVTELVVGLNKTTGGTISLAITANANRE